MYKIILEQLIAALVEEYKVVYLSINRMIYSVNGALYLHENSVWKI